MLAASIVLFVGLAIVSALRSHRNAAQGAPLRLPYVDSRPEAAYRCYESTCAFSATSALVTRRHKYRQAWRELS
jgi:hypothetical protein